MSSGFNTKQVSGQGSGEVSDFWREAGPSRWFKKDASFDDEFRNRFEALHFSAARRELDNWMNDAQGAFALLILLDQFPRNCFRGTGHMFATDALALHFARLMLERGLDKQVEEGMRVFCYLPFEHSELMADQEQAVELTSALGGEFAKAALQHRDIIRRFGRFPHRNKVLGRTTTAEEQKFLDDGGFAG